MKNLNDFTAMKKLDPSGVLDSTALFPDQCESVWDESSKLKFPAEYIKSKNIVVCGMGGSRFTPKTIKELFRDRITVPYDIIDDYSLPNYVNKDSLVILSSYSGSTEEVLSCAVDAVERNAKLTGIMKGGKITDFLKSGNYPVYQFKAEANPCGQPRIGGGYLLMGHAGLLKSMGFLKLTDTEVLSAVHFIREFGKRCAIGRPEKDNPAKTLAEKLVDTHPFIITSEFLKGWGNGFANQINETAKMMSDYRHIPEMNHHLMEGLKRPDTIHKNGLFVFVESDLYSDRVKKRYSITQDVVEKQGIRSHTVKLSGPDKLTQVLEAFTLSGFTTFYLAMIYDTDPVAIPWVDYFKAKLADK